ncbi:vitamin B12-dependent ribonucleotide reductase [Paenactinomyces guangxiensis]|uniref:Vitamin B12-dependent ribonucleotide reductase n=1 Tax=Paenactinomyces guangxiensis TaxID=1490290 RepID=A0A7W1WS11_9BACL|nr:vitamin B12-dependent ribonucleotide reductase [Paenactinomyces guangxiensis]MBA4494947.1 vitamin B12-dependent ribonucleotide reductase [Paenactinomyces guangxiensis]MBH8592030.1 vitamin B12-dependent ribonucleotide reductase [Paenactinomyces guangxiensis]
MKIHRFFTRAGEDPYQSVEYSRRDCRITNPDGSVVFEMKGAEIPKGWSQVASDIMISKYFRKAGVPRVDADGNPILDEEGNPVTGPETSVKQVIHRLAGCWREWGEKNGYFDTEEDAQAFYDELVYMLLHQMAAPNSPQWFNTGLHYAYGITGKPQGHYYVDPNTEELKKADSAYGRPQPHACFIQSVDDDLVNENGIMDLWVREARLFKYGSGTGTNFSTIRGKGEPLSGGGTSSGLLSFLKIGDRAAGAIKSGGTTRRAAKMVCLDMDHPDVEEFINWKSHEEKKVKALIAAGYDPSFNGEAYETVSGQNSNNSIRAPHEFFKKLEEDGIWDLRFRTTGEVCKQIPARELWKQVGQAAWECADPGVQYDGTINEWHTCPAGMDGKLGARHNRINASNPCSEYMFLDNTACNLASLNLVKFFDADTCQFDIPAFRHACRLWTIVLEISVLMAQYPSREIAKLSYEYRTLGLGYANIGTVLMLSGIPYDSDRALAITGAITAIMTGVAYTTSAEMAKELGPFKAFPTNREHMLRVIRNHRRAAYNAPESEYEGLEICPLGIHPTLCPPDLLEAARSSWDQALHMGEKYGYRNAQTTLLAPTGTIGLLMDCDTTGVEPDFALVKFKKLAGGGYFKIANQSIRPALKNLGYSQAEIEDILRYVTGTLSLTGAPHINRETLKQKGFTDADLDRVEQGLPSVFELSFAFNRWALGDDCLERLGFTREQYEAPDFNLLRALGFTRAQIDEANDVICGMMTTEGAPHLKEEHYPVFDTANPCGKHGKRFIHYMGHLRMMAAAQPFLSGAISKTINMPHESTVEDILHAYEQGWKWGLKAVALYRDGSKSSQPLNARGDQTEEREETTSESVAATSETATPTPAAQLKEVVATGHVPSVRRRLPRKRDGFTQEARIAGQKIFVRTGEYEDGSLGEIFIDMHKAGSTMRGMLDAFAVAVSLGLQHGVPLQKYVDSLTFTRFEPAGTVDHPNIKIATSVIDYVFRLLGMEYLEKTDFVQVPPKKEELRSYANRMKKQPDKKSTSVQPPVREENKHQASSAVEKSEAPGSSNIDAIRASSGAPLCIECGGMTKRNGSCYVCLDCGATTGCS